MNEPNWVGMRESTTPGQCVTVMTMLKMKKALSGLVTSSSTASVRGRVSRPSNAAGGSASRSKAGAARPTAKNWLMCTLAK